MSLNVVIVGHIDHGKSTLIGRLLYDSAALPEERMAEMQKLIEEYKKRFEFAYFLDSFEEELKEERTIDTTRILFKGKDYYTVVDVPGHQEFIKNMLTGAAHARVAILVVSCVDGIQEQTRRHAFLVNMLGIKEMIVAINKLDMVDYDEDVYRRTKREVMEMLVSLGYTRNRFVPISAMEGDNIYKPSEHTYWYQGPTLIEALDAIQPEEIAERPLRFVVQDTYNMDSERITVGRVESGLLRKGDKLVFQPSGIIAGIESIRTFPGEIGEAHAGQSVGIVIDGEVCRGDVGGSPVTPPTSVDTFLGEVVLLEGTLRRNDRFELKCGARRAHCRVEMIREQISSETGEVISTTPEEIGLNQAATVVFRTEPVVVENFSAIPELGRFVLAKNGKNVGVGIVLEAGLLVPLSV
jgi:small GTP-binding protein